MQTLCPEAPPSDQGDDEQAGPEASGKNALDTRPAMP